MPRHAVVQVELQVEAIHVISRAEPLPFEVIDASRGDEEVAAAAARGEPLVTVNRDTRLDSRFVDLRTPANQAVFQLQSGVCQVCCVCRWMPFTGILHVGGSAHAGLRPQGFRSGGC